MQGSLESPPIVIRASRVLSSVGLIVCGPLLVKLVVSLVDTSATLEFNDYFLLIALSGGTFYFCLQLIRPAVLEISPEGVTWRPPLGKKHWAWKDINNFRVQSLGAIGCDLSSADSNFKWLRPFNRTVSGNDGALGLGWEGGATTVVSLLTEARKRWA